MSENNRTTFSALMPTDGHKSFYGKAIVATEPDGTRTLYSYGTEIMSIFPDGSMRMYYNDWTATTGRHIKAFAGLNKDEYFRIAGWEKAPTQRASRWDYLDSNESYAYVVRANRLCA